LITPSPPQTSQRPPLTLKLESPGFVAAHFGFRSAGKQIADICKHAGVGRRVGSGRAANRRLVDVDDFVDVFDAQNFLVLAWNVFGIVEISGQGLGQNFVHESRFAGARDAGQTDKFTQRNLEVDVFEVVFGGSDNLERLGTAAAASGWAVGIDSLPDKYLPVKRIFVFGNLGRECLRRPIPRRVCRLRADVYDPVRGFDSFLVMLDYNHGVAEVAEVFQSFEQAVVVALVQARWMVHPKYRARR
jgi:hypothetical protein